MDTQNFETTLSPQNNEAIIFLFNELTLDVHLRAAVHVRAAGGHPPVHEGPRSLHPLKTKTGSQPRDPGGRRPQLQRQPPVRARLGRPHHHPRVPHSSFHWLRRVCQRK